MKFQIKMFFLITCLSFEQIVYLLGTQQNRFYLTAMFSLQQVLTCNTVSQKKKMCYTKSFLQLFAKNR